MAFLYEEINSAKRLGMKVDVPQFVFSNLSESIKLRDYQKEAIENTLLYLNGPLSKNKQTHILYHMATGSGKTVIMAMDILYYYSLGYRNFLFFTNQTNIVSKTKINFLEASSLKYLFANTIVVNGKRVKIKQVENFEEMDADTINICFNTVQGLHNSLSLIKEDSLSIEDFENEKVVLIADEAHHLNSTTSRDKEENELNSTWEDTVNRILFANRDNVLLEFTATCDVKDINVKNKYLDKIVYNFDLREFRKAGYTKEFYNVRSNTSKWEKTLQAIVLSQYRKLLFENHNVSIKPVVLLKSKTIAESNSFYNEFYNQLKELTPSDILSIKERNSNNEFFTNAFKYFDDINVSLENLVDLIKLDFSAEHAVNMNELNVENEKIVNNLDEKNNHYRLVFIVDKLTEGWDVLSLFDIVRLYEKRQGGAKGTVSKYTIKEAQLIGRGARYCPFAFSEGEEKDKRKYSDYANPLSICETLLYHCIDDSKYIDEIKRALKQTGLLPENEPVRVSYRLKDTFKDSDLYNYGYVFLNRKEEVSRDVVRSLPASIRTHGLTYKCQSGGSSSANLMSEGKELGVKYTDLPSVTFRDIPLNILFKAYRSFSKYLSYKELKKSFPHLQTSKEFLTSSSYLGLFPITFLVTEGYNPTNEDMLDAVKIVLQMVADYIQKIEINYIGTKEFYAQPIKSVISDRIRNITREVGDESWGVGVSQNSDLVATTYRMDLSNKEWYVYNDNYGTSEEKKFVKYFSTIINDLEQVFDHIALIRNEIQVCIYSFDDGAKFEPDYILVLDKKQTGKKKGQLYINMFIEPKGQQLLQYDNWKNEFLLQIVNLGIPVVKFVDDFEYRIWGTPLYNESETKEEFERYFKNAVINL